MKRLVYSPSVNAWVKTDSGIFDLSPYIVNFSINRKVNSTSTASISFRNPKVENPDGVSRFLFTQHPVQESDGSISYSPMFHPMDPIIINLTRLKGHPVQVFTGYCDKTPYIQLFPGTANLTASCTLKKLMYTYWDPGLPFVNHYLMERGWTPATGGTANNANAEASKLNLNDSSLGKLLYDVLMDAGGWSHDDIYIQELPSQQISAAVSALYKDLTGDAKASFETFRTFLDEIIGVGQLGGGNAGMAPTPTSTPTSGTSAPPSRGGNYSKRQLIDLWKANGGNAGNANMAAAIALAESSGTSKEVGGPNTDGSYDVGLWQINNKAHPNYFPNGSYDDMKDANKNCKAAITLSSDGSNWGPWSTYHNGSYNQYL